MTVDARVQTLCVAGRTTEAAELIIKEYGGQIMNFMVGHARSAQVANEAFAVFSEDLCRGIPAFQFRCSIRTWIYTVAHHALAKTWRALARTRAITSELPASTDRLMPPAKERTETPPYLRSGTKQQLLELRESLEHDDQVLLELRLEKRFSWKDIARIYLGDQGEGSKPLDTEAARLRKRFQTLKELLREKALARGLLTSAGEE